MLTKRIGLPKINLAATIRPTYQPITPSAQVVDPFTANARIKKPKKMKPDANEKLHKLGEKNRPKVEKKISQSSSFMSSAFQQPPKKESLTPSVVKASIGRFEKEFVQNKN